MKIVFIVSLSHSGSTLVDLLLGAHPNAIGMGEVSTSIKQIFEKQRICTCGNSIDDCEIWGKFKNEYNSEQTSYIEHYNKLMKIIKNHYNREKLVIDSSKGLSSLQLLINNNINDVKILYLVKDIRSFVFSQMARKHSARRMGKEGLRKIYTTTLWFNIYTWNRANRAIKKYLIQENLDFFQFGYEELCFYPELILKKMSEFLGIKYTADMIYPHRGESHIIRGNDMRFDDEALQRIRYDHRWFHNKSYLLYGPLFYPFMDWNKENVYKNLPAPRRPDKFFEHPPKPR